MRGRGKTVSKLLCNEVKVRNIKNKYKQIKGDQTKVQDKREVHKQKVL